MTYQRLVGFGEAMLRFTTPLGQTVATTPEFRTSVGGAELNGLIAGARAGMPGTWVTALPHNPLGDHVARHVRANGVDLLAVPGPDGDATRLGLYFLEMATPPRPLRITYDRRGSAFAQIAPDSVRWGELLGADTCLYLTGITPPLGDGPRAVLDAALGTARENGATVALDVNYRAGLWSRADAAAWLAAVLPHVDILSAGADDLAGAGVDSSDPFAEAVERFELQAVVTTTKRSVDGAVEVRLRALTPKEEQRAEARVMVVDPVGAGDALFGTFLGHLPRAGLAAAVEQALGAAVTCYGLFGDALVADGWECTETRGVVR